jgi:putative Mg2+ transporter-C (MgtC) family protein
MLVTGAAALLVCLGEALITQISDDVAGGTIRSDPIRTVEAIIAGVSFLGAGTIIRSRKGGSVEGLTTAASLLFTAGVGVAVALRELALAIGATLLVLITLRTVHILERRLTSKKSSNAKSGEA